ncbi:MAG TPA: multiheme c-type cytochrome [Gemmataceae bacterium]|nr:multiheme c-type cytochrome [Gemmataceae bacterium]
MANSADPRWTFATPYRNVRPDVKYVGDAACQSCHVRLSKSYHNHPMGRSLFPVSTAPAIENYGHGAHNPFDAAGFRYRIERRGERVLHQETALGRSGKPSTLTQSAEVQFVVGSGEHGRSYLIDRDGYLFASPITWYPQKGIWDLAPGYAANNPHFGRPIGPDCLFCHANQVEHVNNTANRYRLPLFRGTAIGCERCHGPGQLHVQRHQESGEVAGVDETIVNPRQLERGLREAVCQQCHLQGEQRVLRRGRKYFDFRPGLPLQLFFVDFVKPAKYQGDAKFVGTVEQMIASRCYQASNRSGKMGCITCHDPHGRPSVQKKSTHYRARCLSCHGEEECGLPRSVRLKQSAEDSCIVCHMPRTGSDVNHTSITDHRILRRPEARAKQPAIDWPIDVETALVPFPADGGGPDLVDRGRDLGIALMDLAEKQPGSAARQLSARALPLLESSLGTTPADAPAWEAKGSALWFLGRSEEALAALQTALVHAPERETALYLAATLALRMQQRRVAQAYAERAIRVNPWRWQYHQVLVAIHAQANDWQAAVEECQKTLQLNAFSLASRRLLITSYLRVGNRTKAQAEFALLLPLVGPEQQESLRHWFERELR